MLSIKFLEVEERDYYKTAWPGFYLPFCFPIFTAVHHPHLKLVCVLFFFQLKIAQDVQQNVSFTFPP
jgi:hypothetical protein